MQPGPRDGFHRIHHLGTGLGLRIAVSEEGRYGYSYDDEGDAREKALTECANRTTEESVCEITECDENDQSISSRSDAASAGNALVVLRKPRTKRGLSPLFARFSEDHAL